MTVIDLARSLNCHATTIYRFLRQRDVPAFRLGGDWRFQRDAIDEWVEKLTKAGPSEEPTDTHKKGAGLGKPPKKGCPR
jgi:excisionase family DNA binding protein